MERVQAQAREVLEYWFEGVTPENVLGVENGRWLSRDHAGFRERFRKTFDEIVNDHFTYDAWVACGAESLLALVIILEQFASLIQDDKKLPDFINEDTAREVALETLDRSDVKSLTIVQRCCLALPLCRAVSLKMRKLWDEVFAGLQAEALSTPYKDTPLEFIPEAARAVAEDKSAATAGVKILINTRVQQLRPTEIAFAPVSQVAKTGHFTPVKEVNSECSSGAGSPRSLSRLSGVFNNLALNSALSTAGSKDVQANAEANVMWNTVAGSGASEIAVQELVRQLEKWGGTERASLLRELLAGEVTVDQAKFQQVYASMQVLIRGASSPGTPTSPYAHSPRMFSSPHMSPRVAPGSPHYPVSPHLASPAHQGVGSPNLGSPNLTSPHNANGTASPYLMSPHHGVQKTLVR